MYCQHNLRIEIDKYIGEEVMTESRKTYASGLEINLKILPFVIGWLKKPLDEDEYRVIKGIITIDELNKSKKSKEQKLTQQKRANTKIAPKSPPKM